MKIYWIAVLFLFIFIACGRSEGMSWKSVEIIIEQDFPDTSSVSTAQLSHMLDNQEPVVVIDVRAGEEYHVSHILGAEHIESAQEVEKLVVGKNTKIVFYCSVGYRSAKITSELRKQGFTNAFNLTGGIFEWANRGLDVYQNGEKVDTVHPFNKHWGMLLNKKYWSR